MSIFLRAFKWFVNDGAGMHGWDPAQLCVDGRWDEICSV